jgi:basic amino acid/polyamine antiporter, APA family
LKREGVVALQRKLGFWDVFAIATGAMISSGLFILPGQAFGISGPGMVLAYAIAALLMIPALFSKFELATAMPKSGGAYFFVERAIGTLPGLLAGLAAWLSLALKAAFAMIGIGAFARLMFPEAVESEWTIKLIAAAFCLVFMLLNSFSVKVAGRMQIVLVAGMLAAIAAFIIGGAGSVQQHPNFDNFLGKGFGKVFATAGLVFVSFGGLTKAASIGEEVRNPSRNLVGGMLLSYITVSLLYVAVVFIIVGVLPADQIVTDAGPSLTPVSDAAEAAMGRWGLIVLSVAAIIAFVTTGNGGLMTSSRIPMAMSQDSLLPKALGRISPRFHTPTVSVWITGGFMIAVILLLSIADLVKVASTMKLTLFLLMNVAVLIMRYSRLENYRPRYRSPFFPWIQLVGIGLYAALIIELAAMLGPAPLITVGAFLAAGVIWYVIYVRPRTTRESALVVMVRNVVAGEIRHASLEDELRQIALERDAIVGDRFDDMVKTCEVMDIEGPLSADDLFTEVADVLAERLGLDQDTLLAKLREREKDSSTVIQPGLAIPHVIVDGEELFEILPVRCRGGIVFDVAKPPVQTAFILVGSADERNYHLRALMAIAHIVQEEGFIDRWMAAGTTEHLRDLLLLSRRPRDK